MPTIIQKLLSNKQRYYFSIFEGNVSCGNNFYGSIKIEINDDKVIIDQTSLNRDNSTTMRSMEYNNGSKEYDDIIFFKKEIEQYLSNESVILFQENNKASLMQNTMELLPPPLERYPD